MNMILSTTRPAAHRGSAVRPVPVAPARMVLATPLRLWRAMLEWRRGVRSARAMAELDDRLLDDVGIGRLEIADAVRSGVSRGHERMVGRLESRRQRPAYGEWGGRGEP